jgi:NhaP-type Na+/H+ or K+/H+ antiporter
VSALPPSPQKDPLAIGLGALAGGTGLGGGVIVTALLVVQALQRRLDPTSYRQAAADPLLLGLVAAIAVGATFGWWRSRALDNIWQRGVIGVLAAIGALLVGFIAAPVHRFVGLLGLVAWGLASLGLGVAGGRWAARGSRETVSDGP